MYTAVYYADHQVQRFSASSQQEAHQYLRNRARAGLRRQGEIMAIVTGDDDQVVYFNKPSAMCQRLAAFFAGLFFRDS